MSAPESAPLDLVSALALGALQGIAEFLPISSSGHLALAQAWLGIDPHAGGHTLNVLLHAGTLLAVVWTYRDALWGMLRALLTPRRYPLDFAYALRVIAATLPLGLVLIPAFKELVVSMEGSVRAIGSALAVSAGFLTAGHFAAANRRPASDASPQLSTVPPSWRQAWIVGLVQVVAVLPGISRAGSTIAAGLMVGLGRPQAAQFSFLLSIPAVLGAVTLESIDLFASPSGVPLPLAAALCGMLTSFIVGLLTLKWLLRLLTYLGPLPFVPYLLALSALAIWLG